MRWAGNQEPQGAEAPHGEGRAPQAACALAARACLLGSYLALDSFWQETGLPEAPS